MDTVAKLSAAAKTVILDGDVSLHDKLINELKCDHRVAARLFDHFLKNLLFNRVEMLVHLVTAYESHFHLFLLSVGLIAPFGIDDLG